MAVLPDLTVKVPTMRLDGIPVDVRVERLENSRAFTMTLKLSVPDIERFSANPDSNLVFAAIRDAIGKHEHKLRLELVPDKLIQSEFERLQEDGSIRDLMPQEGT